MHLPRPHGVYEKGKQRGAARPPASKQRGASSDWRDRLRAAVRCWDNRAYDPDSASTSPDIIIRTPRPAINVTEEPKQMLPLKSTDSMSSGADSPCIQTPSAPSPVLASGPSSPPFEEVEPEWVEGPLVGRQSLQLDKPRIAFHPVDYAQFRDGPYPHDQRARSLMLASQANPFTFWEHFRSTFARSGLSMWSIKTDLMTPFPDALHPTDKQDDGGKYPLAFQQESHRHWHQDSSLLHPATTTAGVDVMIRLVGGPGKSEHEINTLRALQRMQQQEKFRCWSPIRNFYEIGPWTFAVYDWDPFTAQRKVTQQCRTLGNCLTLIRHLTYALWVLHENLIFHRDVRASNIIAEPVQSTSGCSRSEESRFVLSGFQHAIKWPDDTPREECLRRGRAVVQEPQSDPKQWPPEARGLADKSYSPFAVDIYQLGYLVHSLFHPLKDRIPELSDYLKSSYNTDRHARSSTGVLLFHCAAMQQAHKHELEDPVPLSMQQRKRPPPWVRAGPPQASASLPSSPMASSSALAAPTSARSASHQHSKPRVKRSHNTQQGDSDVAGSDGLHLRRVNSL